MTTSDWSKRPPPRRDRYLMALEAMKAVDVINGTYRATSSFEQSVAWAVRTWEDPGFQARFTVPPSSLGTVTPLFHNRVRRGWTTAPKAPRGLRVHIEIGGPQTDVDLATMLGATGRIAGIHGRATTTPVLDRWTVTIATAALLVHDPTRAREYWDIMAAIGIPGHPTEDWPL